MSWFFNLFEVNRDAPAEGSHLKDFRSTSPRVNVVGATDAEVLEFTTRVRTSREQWMAVEIVMDKSVKLSDTTCLELTKVVSTKFPAVHWLSLEQSGIGDEGACAIAHIYARNFRLDSVILWGNAFTEVGGAAFAVAAAAKRAELMPLQLLALEGMPEAASAFRGYFLLNVEEPLPQFTTLQLVSKHDDDILVRDRKDFCTGRNSAKYARMIAHYLVSFADEDAQAENACRIIALPLSFRERGEVGVEVAIACARIAGARSRAGDETLAENAERAGRFVQLALASVYDDVLVKEAPLTSTTALEVGAKPRPCAPRRLSWDDVARLSCRPGIAGEHVGDVRGAHARGPGGLGCPREVRCWRP